MRILEYLNQTLITLIPKCNSPESINNYRPIGLCNTIYKIITKLIMARLHWVLNQLVSPLQTAFVPNRKGVDNAIIVQELVHTMSRKQGSEGLMSIKIDLEKAYDWFEWSFIRDTFLLYKFPNHLVSLIMSCVSSSTISMLFNGGALESFQLTRVIRQGDPFSSYLFILCMEVLGTLIVEKCEESCGTPCRLLEVVWFFHICFLLMILSSLQRLMWKIVWL